MSYSESWEEEKQSAYLYRVIAEKEKDSTRSVLFSSLAREADRQAEIWERKIREASLPTPASYEPNVRVRLVAALVRYLGPRSLRTPLAAMKIRGMSIYDAHPVGHPMPSNVEEIGRRHKGTKSGGNLRAAVFGVSDGLVSNASLILGIAGATQNPHVIVLTGIAGLLAGAFSMAAGEFVSVKSQSEMYEYQIGLERDELNEYPAQEAEELALIYQAKGLSEQEAHDVATKLISDPDKALDTLAREELGLNPEALGSPWGASTSSFLSFACGAILPLIPFLVTSGRDALLLSIGLTALALFGVGAVMTLFTGKNALWGGLRMLAIGTAAGAITFEIGRLLGVNLT